MDASVDQLVSAALCFPTKVNLKPVWEATLRTIRRLYYNLSPEHVKGFPIGT